MFLKPNIMFKLFTKHVKSSIQCIWAKRNHCVCTVAPGYFFYVEVEWKGHQLLWLVDYSKRLDYITILGHLHYLNYISLF